MAQKSYRTFDALLAISFWLACPVLALSAEMVIPMECERGVCGFNVVSRILSVMPCKDRPIFVAYLQSGGVVLFQCGTSGNPSVNLSYLFDQRTPNGVAFELAGSRFIKPDSVEEVTESGVPDRFGTIALCVPPNKLNPVAGEMQLLVKMPRGSDGYCYRLLRVFADSDGLKVHADDSQPLTLTPAEATKWQRLRGNLMPFVRQGRR